MKMVRQGDILLMSASEQITETAQKIETVNDRIVVALGEVTGHSHTIDGSTATMYRDEVLNREWLVVDTDTEMVHQEHAPVTIEQGTWLVVRQREYQRGTVRNVLD